MVCNGVAEICILLISRGFCQELERFIRGSGRDSAGRKLVHDLLKQRLIFGFRWCDSRWRVEVLFEAGLKKRVIADVPALPVPSDNIAAGVEEGYVLPKKA